MSTFVNHVFGKTIAFRYTPAAAGRDFEAYTLTSARIYDVFPSDGQRANTLSGHVEAVTSWTYTNVEGTGRPEYLVSFAAIADPSPTDSRDYHKYYVALNYKNVALGSDVQDVEQIFLYRPRGFTGKIRITAADVYALDSSIEDVAPDRQWTETKCTSAIDYIQAKLKARKYDLRSIFNWEELNPAAVRIAAYYCSLDRAAAGSEFWLEKARLWKDEGDLMFDGAAVGYDILGDGRPEPDETVQTGGTVAPLR